MHDHNSLSFTPATALPYRIVTLIARENMSLARQDVHALLSEHGASIHHEQWLNHPDSLNGNALDILFSGGDLTLLRSLLTAYCESVQIDCVIQPFASREKKLLISDMDSTIINEECIDELADMVGLKHEVSTITTRAMNGELDFAAALTARVQLLKGLTIAEMQRVLEERITLMSGAKTLIATLRAHGIYCVLVSGGFTFFTEAILQRVGFDAQYANTLLMENACLTGAVAQPILGKEAKRDTLLQLAQKRTISLSETIAIGDGANDLPMILEAGLGIAYHAKPSVEAAATHRIRYNDLTALLYVLGIPESEWVTYDRLSVPR